jgi:hypothetical protein
MTLVDAHKGKRLHSEASEANGELNRGRGESTYLDREVAGMAQDPLISHTSDRTVAVRLMIDRHWISDHGVHSVVTYADVRCPGRSDTTW